MDGFIRTPKPAAEAHLSATYSDAESLTVYFETKPDIVAKLLPPPLRPAKSPIAAVLLANYPRTNLGISYAESALFLSADFRGEQGVYCLAMDVTDDMALILGRERFGYPKKMGEISLTRAGQRMTGWVHRRGVRFCEVEVNLNGKFNEAVMHELVAEQLQSPDGANQVIYNFKYFPAVNGHIDDASFDHNPRLVRSVAERKLKTMEIGEARLSFYQSKYDPWSDVEIVRTLGAIYTVGEVTLPPGNAVAETDAATFAPYAFTKRDSFEPES
jgi:acetoacetate decarboxylase